MSRAIMVNLWAPPGVGKSTAMAGLFAFMKHSGLSVELSPEFAKGLSYRADMVSLADPFYVTAQQEFQNFQVSSKVRYIITDSPTGIAALYCRKEDRSMVLQLAEHMRARYVNFDVRLMRNPERHFQQYGRHHTEEQSKALEASLTRIINRLATGPTCEVLSDAAAPAIIAEWQLKEEFNYGFR